MLDESWRYEEVVYTSSHLLVLDQGLKVRDYAESGSEQVSLNCYEEIAPAVIESDTMKVLSGLHRSPLSVIVMSDDRDEGHLNCNQVGSNTVYIAESLGVVARHGISAGVGVPNHFCCTWLLTWNQTLRK